MEAVIFCGLQASGKTTFYAQRFLKTHLRISLDLVRTRHRERLLLHTCLATGLRFVVDNTNPTPADRRRYLEGAKAHRFRVVGYFFYTQPMAALQRDAGRTAAEQVPAAGIFGTYKILEPLRYTEGFDELYWVTISNGGFVVTEGEWKKDDVDESTS